MIEPLNRAKKNIWIFLSQPNQEVTCIFPKFSATSMVVL